MAQGNPYARIVNIMSRKGKEANGYDMVKAKVVSIDPLCIAVNGQIIEDHIFFNNYLTSDKDEELEEILAQEEYISEGLKTFLKDLYKSLRVQAGDQLLAQRVGNSFYICGKVGMS